MSDISYIKHALTNIHISEGGFVGDAKKNLKMKAARVGAGLSQSDLAAKVGATRQTIGLIEAGGYNPTLNLCIAICKELGVTLNDLFWPEEA